MSMISKCLIFLLLCSPSLLFATGGPELDLPSREEAAAWLSEKTKTSITADDLELQSSLTFHRACINDDDLRYLSYSKELSSLYIYNDECKESFLRGPGLVYLKDLKNLNSIDFDYNEIDPKYFYFLKDLPNLQNLSVMGNYLGDRDSLGFSHLSRLTSLNLRDNGINAGNALSFFQGLALLPMIETLKVGDNDFPVEAMAPLGETPLKNLHLSSGIFPTKPLQIHLSIQGIKTLQTFKQLEYLDAITLADTDDAMVDLLIRSEFIVDLHRPLTADEAFILALHNPKAWIIFSKEFLEKLKDQQNLDSLKAEFAERSHLNIEFQKNINEASGVLETLKSIAGHQTLSLDLTKIDTFIQGDLLDSPEFQDYVLTNTRITGIWVRLMNTDFIKKLKVERPDIEILRGR